MSDLMEHYQPKMPTDGQIRAQNYFSQNCDSSDPAPVQDAHSWMTGSLSADDDTLADPPAELRPVIAAAMQQEVDRLSPQQLSSPPAPQQQRRQPAPGDFIGLPSSPAVRAFMLAGGTCRISPAGYFAVG